MTEIKQIAISGDDTNAQMLIFGLGDDSLVYRWNTLSAEWELWKQSTGGLTDVPY